MSELAKLVEVQDCYDNILRFATWLREHDLPQAVMSPEHIAYYAQVFFGIDPDKLKRELSLSK